MRKAGEEGSVLAQILQARFGLRAPWGDPARADGLLGGRFQGSWPLLHGDRGQGYKV